MLARNWLFALLAPSADYEAEAPAHIFYALNLVFKFKVSFLQFCSHCIKRF